MNIPVTPADAAEIVRLRRKIDGMRGPGITNTHTSISFCPPPFAPPVPEFSLPRTRQKYQVLQVIDDAGTIDWDDVRFR